MAQRRKNYPWEAILQELQAQPNVWRLFPEMAGRPASLIQHVNRRGVRAIRAPGGVVQARAGWTGTTVEGRVIADCYLRWRIGESNG